MYTIVIHLEGNLFNSAALPRLHPLGCGDGPSFLTQDHGLPLHLATTKPRSNILVSWDYDIP